MRNVFSETLYQCATEDPRVCIVVADISPVGSMASFREEYPDRFINVGVAEQVMIGICAGLAIKGRQPFAYTIAPFTFYRPFEMVRVDLAYQNLPVTVVGMGSGIVYSTLGSTHHTLEDVAIASAIPNMQVLAPCDPLETELATRFCATQKNGPVYLKLGKAGEPVLTQDAAEPFVFGKPRVLRRGRDIAVLSYGPIMGKAVQLVDALAAKGKSVSLVNVHTLKPLDRGVIAEILTMHAEVVVIEEHVPHGGLAGQVKEIAWDAQADCKLHTFTLTDAFLHCYGSYDQLLAAHGITVEKMVAEVG